MAGTINLAFTQQFDMDGVPLSGGLLYFFSAGTTTPQSAFQDTGLTIVHPNPIVLDSSGRVPMFYLADGFIKVRLTDKNGVTIIAADQLLVIGPSTSTGGGGGGGTPSDQSQLIQTGDIKARYSTIVLDGFVRLNGLTIGNAGSSATERADPACQPLFVYLWPFPGITLDGFVKGASALADFGAGRRMFLPDLRGRTIAGLDDMGNPAPASRLTSTYFGVAGTVLGNAGGNEKHSLTAAELAPHTHGGSGNTGAASADHSHTFSGTTSDQSNAHTHTFNAILNAANVATAGPNTVGSPTAAQGTTDANNVGHTHTYGGTTSGMSANHTHGFSFNTDTGAGVSGTNHSVANPAMVMTFYMKM